MRLENIPAERWQTAAQFADALNDPKLTGRRNRGLAAAAEHGGGGKLVR